MKLCSPVKELVSLYRPLAQVEMCQSGRLRPSRPRDPSLFPGSRTLAKWAGRGQALGHRFQGKSRADPEPSAAARAAATVASQPTATMVKIDPYGWARQASSDGELWVQLEDLSHKNMSVMEKDMDIDVWLLHTHTPAHTHSHVHVHIHIKITSLFIYM